MDKTKILEALQKLDQNNDDHWTSDGAPRMAVLEEMLGTKSVDRRDVVAAAPEFSRQNPILPLGEQPTVQKRPEQELKNDEDEAAEDDETVERRQHMLATIERSEKEARDTQLEIERLERKKEAAQASAAAAQKAMENEFPRPTQAEVVQQFVKSQFEQRMQRHSRVQAARAALEAGGVGNGAKAPVDASRERRRGLGQQPKVVPLLSGGQG